MLAFSEQPAYTKPMLSSSALNITILADDKGAVLTINYLSRYIDYRLHQTEQALRELLADEPAYIADAVIGMLKEMAA